MLLLWKRNFREYATPERLARALEEIGRNKSQGKTEDGKACFRAKTFRSEWPDQQRQLQDCKTARQDQPRLRSSPQSYLSSTVQVRGLPFPIQERNISDRSQLRSDKSLKDGRFVSSQGKESRRKTFTSVPGKITLDVDIQRMAVKNIPLTSKKAENSFESDEVPSIVLPPSISNMSGDTVTGAESLANHPRAGQQRRVKCRCSVHRCKEPQEGNTEEGNVDTKDPFDNLLKGLQDPFFKRLMETSSEVDAAVDQLEKMKGVFVDETKLMPLA
ncbi:uncharacterized protein LOC110978252 [Acanthaster planci]|uniref:Uncharacterized protein LOC110978252 n=1 Tax=Acanthaster planci TaxID=133434 RepID=A0A8B7Y6D8_ACAPL|nr:uncharacterized protein LOC110978252 [Acanthaster planci]